MAGEQCFSLELYSAMSDIRDTNKKGQQQQQPMYRGIFEAMELNSREENKYDTGNFDLMRTEEGTKGKGQGEWGVEV